ncbi:MAG: hypothetical protein RJA87_1413 [Pseudomonadota bacterium]
MLPFQQPLAGVVIRIDLIVLEKRNLERWCLAVPSQRICRGSIYLIDKILTFSKPAGLTPLGREP